jgi:hypothetical protein
MLQSLQEHGDEDDEPMDIVVDTAAFPSLDLTNHGVDAQFRGYRPHRRSYRVHVMKKLYAGNWRYAWPFSVALAWFVKWIIAAVSTEYMARKTYKGMWKVGHTLTHGAPCVTHIPDSHPMCR